MLQPAYCRLIAHEDDTDLERVGRGIKEGVDLENLQKGFL